MEDDNGKPWVVILGGCGFIGRNLLEYLLSEDLVAGVRLVDKVPPQMAWLNATHSRTFADPRVEYFSANLINATSCAMALCPKEGTHWGLVVNCAGETKTGQTDPVYKEGILSLSLNCARECARLKVQRYVEISSACVYSNSSKNGHKEEEPTAPWTVVSKWKMHVEEELWALCSETGLRCTVLRPVSVYGKGDRRNLMPRLLVGSIYSRLGKVMKLMWGPELAMDTVHVWDLCAAVWFVTNKQECQGQTYNVVDQGQSTQGTITDIVTGIFNIKTDYLSSTVSHLAKGDLTSVLEELNDQHLSTWANACRMEGIENTPLDPTMTEEMLTEKNLRVDGSKLRDLGFQCHHPTITIDNVKEVIDDYVAMGLFPKCLMN